jgi:hypothetical protein
MGGIFFLNKEEVTKNKRKPEQTVIIFSATIIASFAEFSPRSILPKAQRPHRQSQLPIR